MAIYPQIVERARHRLRDLSGRIGELLFPERCAWCGARRTPLCPACLRALPRYEGDVPPWLLSLFAFRDPAVGTLVRTLKYRNATRVATAVGPALYEGALDLLEDHGFLELSTALPFVLIPVPLSARRLAKRRYNQSELLAREVANRDPVSFMLRTDLIEKIKETRSQVEVKDRAERLVNLKDSFRVRYPAELAGRVCIVVDDVTTTGATLGEVRRMVAQANPRAILALTLAH